MPTSDCSLACQLTSDPFISCCIQPTSIYHCLFCHCLPLMCTASNTSVHLQNLPQGGCIPPSPGSFLTGQCWSFGLHLVSTIYKYSLLAAYITVPNINNATLLSYNSTVFCSQVRFNTLCFVHKIGQVLIWQCKS